MIRGETQFNRLSRFVQEIPSGLFGQEAAPAPKKSTETKNPYRQAKDSFKKKPVAVSGLAAAKNFGAAEKKALDYTEGDRVSHIKFGEGIVTNIVEGGRDYEVTVDFDKAGTKKMFASFAKLKKL